METMPDDCAEKWLTVARTHGDHLVHLVVRGDGSSHSLCGRPLRGRAPQRSFRQSGCEECLVAARAAGHVVAQEERAWLNLQRMALASPSA
jgi:hypothetical protein